jgi:hypothetical protein
VRNCESGYWKKSWVAEPYNHPACFIAIADESIQNLAINPYYMDTDNTLKPQLLACNERADRVSLARQTIACWQARSREDRRSRECHSDETEHDIDLAEGYDRDFMSSRSNGCF